MSMYELFGTKSATATSSLNRGTGDYEFIIWTETAVIGNKVGRPKAEKNGLLNCPII